jgi:hypothetical protein
MGNEQHETIKMPEVRKTFRLRNRACKGFNILAAIVSRRETGCYMHGVLPEEKVVNESN